MNHGVLLALTEGEVALVRALDAPGSGTRVVRRCADLAELLAAAAAGIGTVAVVSSRLPGVDRATIGRLSGAGARVLVVGPSGDVDRLRRLGAHATAAESEPAERIARTVLALARGERVDLAAPVPSSGSPSSGSPLPGSPSTAAGLGPAAGNSPAAGPSASVGQGSAVAAPGPAPGPGDGRATDEGGAESDDGVITAVPWWSGATAAGTDHARGGGTTREGATGDGRGGHGTGGQGTGGHGTGGDGTSGEGAASGRSGGARGGSAHVPTAEPGVAEAPGRIVVVWGTRGAPGRSTIAVNLAAEAAALGRPTVVVDADTEAPSLTQVLGLSEDISSIAAVARLATHGRLDVDALRPALVPVAEDLTVLTGLTRPDRWRELEDSSLEVLWDLLRDVAGLIVVDVAAGAEEGDAGDLGPARHQATLSALAAADHVVVVGAADPVGMRRLVLALTELRERELAPGADRTVVVNRVRRAAAGPDPAQAVREALWRYAGDQDAHLVPEDPSTADSALLAGSTWLEQAPGSAAREAVAALTRTVLDLPPAEGRAGWRRRVARLRTARRG